MEIKLMTNIVTNIFVAIFLTPIDNNRDMLN